MKYPINDKKHRNKKNQLKMAKTFSNPPTLLPKWMGATLLVLMLQMDLVLMRAQTRLIPDDMHEENSADNPFEDEEPNEIDRTMYPEINKYDQNDPNYAEKGHKPGGLPMMSDSLFSLIILVYVSLAFCIVFFLFCWKANNGRGGGGPNGMTFKQECPLMTNELDEAKALAMMDRNSLVLSHGHLNSCTLSAVHEEKETSSV